MSDRSDYERYHNVLSAAYEWRHRDRLDYKLTFLNIDLVSARISSSFLEQLIGFDNSLFNSFRSTLSSSVSFQLNWNHNYTGFGPIPGRSFRIFLETGGHLNELYRSFAEANDLEQYVFSKASIEYTQSLPVSGSSNLVWRLRIGAAIPHGKNRALPYEKYFFMGGSNSVRAWRPRRLGPGSYAPPNVEESIIEQRGELLLEANLELRTQINKRWHGAWFIDAGNLWFTRGPDRAPGALFSFPSSITEIAIGTGPGIRIDFSYFLLRLDIGIKVYDPTQPKSNRFVLTRRSPFELIRDLLGPGEYALFNLSINYPF